MRLFVYGTLIRGGGNHSLLAPARALGPAVTELGFGLVDLGPYPGMFRCRGELRVGGELYRVGPATLQRLDRFELHPHLFRRTAVGLAGRGTAWAYLIAPELAGEHPPLPAASDGIVRWAP